MVQQFGENGLQLGFELLDPFLLSVLLGAVGLFNSHSAVLEKLLLPAAENRRLQIVFVTKVRDGNVINQMPFEDKNLLLTDVIFTLFARGEFLRCCRLTQTLEFFNSR